MGIPQRWQVTFDFWFHAACSVPGQANHRDGVEESDRDKQPFPIWGKGEVVRSGTPKLAILHFGCAHIKTPGHLAIGFRSRVVVDQADQIGVLHCHGDDLPGRMHSHMAGMAAGRRGACLLQPDREMRRLASREIDHRDSRAIVETDVEGLPVGRKRRGVGILGRQGRMSRIRVEIEHAIHALEGAAELHGSVAQRECSVDQVFAGIVRIGLHRQARRRGRRIVVAHAFRQGHIGRTDLNESDWMQTSFANQKDPDAVLSAIAEFRVFSRRGQREIQVLSIRAESNAIKGSTDISRPVKIQPGARLGKVRDKPGHPVVDGNRFSEPRSRMAIAVIQESHITTIRTDG
uniref:Uncharacterized protein n=1 Tax=uncultured marine bacterium PPT_M2 TaxID=1381397 RepID=A0A067XRD3_9BACT|nr:hypothetical protein PPT_M2_37 [uncultured marine bacterium PPT_M2]